MLKMESNRQNCIVCTTVMDSQPVNVNKYMLQLFKFLVETIDTSVLQNALICTSCIEKIQEAVNFKTSYLSKQKSTNIEIKQETAFNEKYVVCHICKNTTKQDSLMSLFNSCYENVVNYMIPKEDSGNLVDPQICNSCQASALNFQSLILFLSDYDLNKTNNEQLTNAAVIDEIKFKIDVVENCLPEDSKLFINMTQELQQVIKKEVEESEEDFQLKQEVNLKVDCEAGPSNAGSFNVDDKDITLALQCPGNLTADLNKSNWTASVIKTEMDYKESSILNNEKFYENLNDNFDNIEIYKCNNLEFHTMHTNDLYRHAQTHGFIHNTNEVELFKCQNCQYQTKQKGNLKRHMLIHKDTNNVEMFKCQSCHFQTKHKISLKQHLLTHKDTNEVELFKCQNCQFQTKHKISLKRHLLIHKDTHSIELFKCQNCQFRTKQKRYLERHMFIHKDTNEVKLFKCQNCQYQTKQKGNLKRHMLLHENTNKVEMFKCQNCQLRTKHKYEHLLTHKDTDEVVLFKCQNCQYQTKQKLFKCHICLFQTKRKDNLLQHMVIHKNKNEVELFKCKNCQFQTKHKRYLNGHMLIHKDTNEIKMFKCQNCQFETKHKISLKRHLLTHKDINAVELFKCQNCQFQTKYKISLKRHLLIHKDTNGG